MINNITLIQSFKPGTTTAHYAKGHLNGLFIRTKGAQTVRGGEVDLKGSIQVLLNTKEGNEVIVNNLTIEQISQMSDLEFGNINKNFCALLSLGKAENSGLAEYLGLGKEKIPTIADVSRYMLLDLGSIYFKGQDSIILTVDNDGNDDIEIYAYENNNTLYHFNKYIAVNQPSHTFEGVNKVYCFPRLENPFKLISDYNVTTSSSNGENYAKIGALIDYTNSSKKIESIPTMCALLYDSQIDDRVNILTGANSEVAPTLIGVSRHSDKVSINHSVIHNVTNVKKSMLATSKKSFTSALVHSGVNTDMVKELSK